MDYIAPELAAMNFTPFMQAALAEAELAGQAGELPIGAVVVVAGEIVARGRARHQERQTQLAHAEMNALLAGGEPLWRDYRRAVLFTTVEPCPMCLGALVMADVPHLVYALHDRVVMSEKTLAANPYVRRHLKTYHGGVLAAEAIAVMREYAPKTLDYILTGRN